MNTITATLLPIASIGVGCFMLYIAWKGYASTRNMKEWEITQGTITKSSVKQAEAAWLPDIEYQYFVLGVEYKGNSVTIPPDVIYEAEVAQGVLEQYSLGKKVDVFYNPEVPRVAVLEKEARFGTWWFLFLAIGTALFFLVLGCAFLLR
jgi:hypothetical protein